MGASTRRAAQLVLGSAVGLALVAWLFRGTDWGRVSGIFRALDGRWIAVSQVLLWSSHFVRVERWTQIIRASRAIRYRTVFGAAQVGFLFNVILPMRLGEGVRALYLSRRAGMPFSTSVALVALDRATDMIGMLTLALVALAAFPGDRGVELPAGTLGNAESLALSGAYLKPVTAAGVLFLVAVLSALFLLHSRRAAMTGTLEKGLACLPDSLAERLRRAARGFVDGMQVFDDARGMWRAVGWSLVSWVLAALSLGCILRAFGIDHAWFVPFAMQAAIALFSSAPIVPGLIGQFHLAVVACLLIAVPGVDLDEAKAAAIATHLLALAPVVVLGVYCLASDRTRGLESAVSLPETPPIDRGRRS